MTGNELLTIKEISRRLGLAESTVKYYRDRFPEFMPTVEIGRYPKYKPEALEIFKIIAEGYSDNLQQQDIADRLSAEYAINTEQSETSLAAATAAATGQQLEVKENYRVLAQANSEIYYLRQLVKDLQQDNTELTRHNTELTRRLLEAPRRPGWWAKLFKRR